MTTFGELSRTTSSPDAPGFSLRCATDDELLTRFREGEVAALAELYERHRADAYRYARRLSHRHLRRDVADDVLAEAVRKVLAALQHGRGPTTGFRLYLFTAVRSVALSERQGIRDDDTIAPADDVRAVGDDDHMDAFASEAPSTDEHLDALMVMTAFDSLPARWRHVLWATEVVDLTPTEVGHSVGLRANSVAALALRAREALRIAYVRTHLPRPPHRCCDDALGLIARRTILALTATQTTLLDEHLASCDRCRDAAAGLRDEIVGWSRAVGDDLAIGEWFGGKAG